MALFLRRLAVSQPPYQVAGRLGSLQSPRNSVNRWFSARKVYRTHALPSRGGRYVSFSQRRRKERMRNSNFVGGWLVSAVAMSGGVGSAILMAQAEEAPTVLRTQSFPLTAHNHGKTRVRLLKVDRSSNTHVVQEYSVTTTVYCQETEKCFTQGDNDKIVATDTQKNSVYAVAKQNQFNSPEEFALLLSKFLLENYPWLDAAGVQVNQVVWERATVDGQEHPHGFVQTSPETQQAAVYRERDHPPILQSSLHKMTVLKTTMSGFEDYALDDKYTLLPPTKERCLATELDAVWTFSPGDHDYNAVRQRIRQLFLRGIFGPPSTGVYSPSLQATVYDAACLILTQVPGVDTISIYTPNLHYIPATSLLEKMGEKFEGDVFIPTSEPSGVITCTVGRGDKIMEVLQTPAAAEATQSLENEVEEKRVALKKESKQAAMPKKKVTKSKDEGRQDALEAFLFKAIQQKEDDDDDDDDDDDED